jgi:phosphatidylglycerol:prolipoprotein diacylglycerol transferase
MTDFYPWLISMGAIAVVLWLGLVEPKPELPKSPFLHTDAGIFSLVVGFIGARLGFVLSHLHYFSLHTQEILMYWNGGLSWVGGAIGALLGLGLFAAIKKQSFWLILDSMAIPATILSFCAWFGCLMDGCAYGEQANFGYLTPLSPDNLGIQLHRWPVQGSGAILALGFLLLLNRIRPTNLPPGVLGTLSLLMISGSNLLLAFFRGDQVPILNGFRSDGVTSAILVILSLVTLALRFRETNEPETTN